MNRVLLALGYRPLEDYIQKYLKNEMHFVGVTVHREGILHAVKKNHPDLLVVRENLDGKENIMTIVHTLRTEHPELRIVFLAGDRRPGDALLANLVSYGVYDILYGEKINAKDIIPLMREKNVYANVKHLQPKPIFDEATGKMIFEAPNASEPTEREVVRTVYVNADAPTPEPEPEPKKKEAKEPEKKAKPEAGKGLFGRKKTNPPVETSQAVAPEPVPAAAPAEAASGSEPNETHQEKVVEEPKKSPLIDKLWSSRGTKEEEKAYLRSNNQKILTFMGTKHGVGTTTIAFNYATELAKRHKVLYLEWGERHAASAYWYELGHVNHGIDTALRGILEQDLQEVMKAITHVRDERKKETTMGPIHKRLPENLDCLYFSGTYMMKGRLPDDDECPMILAKDLFLYLLFQGTYDYIVLDVPADHYYGPTIQALSYAHRIFCVTTQDVASLGQAVKMTSELRDHGIDLGVKAVFLVNRFEKMELDERRIKDWLGSQKVLTIPEANRESLLYHYEGVPAATKPRSFLRASVKQMHSHI